jgi:hypothetical protein
MVAFSEPSDHSQIVQTIQTSWEITRERLAARYLEKLWWSETIVL